MQKSRKNAHLNFTIGTNEFCDYIMLMKKLLLYILIGGILLIGTYGCANYEEDLLDEISPKQMLATVTTEIELADAVYHRDTVLDPAAE